MQQRPPSNHDRWLTEAKPKRSTSSETLFHYQLTLTNLMHAALYVLSLTPVIYPLVRGNLSRAPTAANSGFVDVIELKCKNNKVKYHARE